MNNINPPSTLINFFFPLTNTNNPFASTIHSTQPITSTKPPNELDSWQITSVEISRHIDILGYKISPEWQGFSSKYSYLKIYFECIPGKSLIERLINKDMGLTFIHEAQGYPHIYVIDARGEKHFATMIGYCWLSIPILPEKHGFTLFINNFPPIDLTPNRPSKWSLEQILFVSKRDGNPDIFRMNPDGSEQEVVIRNSAMDLEPAISPDGKNILFTSDREGNQDIYLSQLNSDLAINLSHHPAEDGAPAFSPDGKNIIFHSTRNGNWDVLRMDISGQTLVNLSRDPGSDQFPSWSQNQEMIAFQSNRDGNWELYLMDADGSNINRITHHPAADVRPSWAPNGPVLVFWSRRDGFWRLYRINIETLALVAITDYAQPGSHISTPSWSRDGERILFSIIRDGNQEIYQINKDGSNPRRLTRDLSDDYDPEW